jgi:OmcA/MtrC family decaheme c-type cytochrome
MWLYVVETLTINGQQVRDTADALLSFRLGEAGPIQPRQVIVQAACDSCHDRTQAHGGSRRQAEGCPLCHTQGSVDRTVGARGLACTTNAQCPGFAAGWETCQDTTNDGTPDTCVVTVDPTPGASIRFPVLIHSIHFARLRDGYAERANLVNPGQLSLVGFRNTVVDLSEILLPQDVRNCTKCHADSGATCSATAPCGYGQTCQASHCMNDAWFSAPSAEVCLSCHDSAEAHGHAAIMTYTDPQTGQAVETCEVCHGTDADFSIKKVHDIAHPYRPPYPRTKE